MAWLVPVLAVVGAAAAVAGVRELRSGRRARGARLLAGGAATVLVAGLAIAFQAWLPHLAEARMDDLVAEMEPALSREVTASLEELFGCHDLVEDVEVHRLLQELRVVGGHPHAGPALLPAQVRGVEVTIRIAGRPVDATLWGAPGAGWSPQDPAYEAIREACAEETAAPGAYGAARGPRPVVPPSGAAGGRSVTRVTVVVRTTRLGAVSHQPRIPAPPTNTAPTRMPCVNSVTCPSFDDPGPQACQSGARDAKVRLRHWIRRPCAATCNTNGPRRGISSVSDGR